MIYDIGSNARKAAKSGTGNKTINIDDQSRQGSLFKKNDIPLCWTQWSLMQ